MRIINKSIHKAVVQAADDLDIGKSMATRFYKKIQKTFLALEKSSNLARREKVQSLLPFADLTVQQLREFSQDNEGYVFLLEKRLRITADNEKSLAIYNKAFGCPEGVSEAT